MNRVQMLQAPKLNTQYAHSNALGDFAKSMRAEAQQGLVFNEQKRQNQFDNAHKVKVYDRGVLESDRAFDFNKTKDARDFEYGKSRDLTSDYFKKENLKIDRINANKKSEMTPYQVFSANMKALEQQQRVNDRKSNLGQRWLEKIVPNINNYDELAPDQQNWMREQYIKTDGLYNPQIIKSGGTLGFFQDYTPKGWVAPNAEVAPTPKPTNNGEYSFEDLKKIKDELDNFKL